MNLSFKKIMVPTASAVVGGLAVIAVLKVNPALQVKLNGNAYKDPKSEVIYDDILKNQKEIRNNFDGLFEDDFFDRDVPLKRMRRMREQMEKRMGDFAERNKSRSNPFDNWFSGKSVSGNNYDISKREDDNFVYYDIKIDDLNSTSINTNVENGYVTITGTLETRKDNRQDEDNDKLSFQSIYKSTFNRTFPLPDNVNADKMQMIPEKDKVVLKFPKVSA